MADRLVLTAVPSWRSTHPGHPSMVGHYHGCGSNANFCITVGPVPGLLAYWPYWLQQLALN